MNPKQWIPALATAVLLVSCNATDRRISANEELFQSYTPAEQAMIRSNRIDRGFDSNMVYLSFGHADRTAMEGDQELWFYHQQYERTEREEKTAAEYRDELASYYYAVEQGEQGLQEPATYRVVHLYRTGVYRLVRFESGRVVSWEEPQDMWVDDWHR